jgi:hypothetical protein
VTTEAGSKDGINLILYPFDIFRYTKNKTFAREVTYPLLSGMVEYWGCYLNKTVNPQNASDYTYNDNNSFNPGREGSFFTPWGVPRKLIALPLPTSIDDEHEQQAVPNPQIALAFIRRLTSFQIYLARELELPPATLAADIFEHLAPFNTQEILSPVPGVTNFTDWDHTRCFHDSGFLLGATTAQACEALCASDPVCDIYSFCPNTSVPGCTLGPPHSCWRFTAAQAAGCNHSTPGWTSGQKNHTGTLMGFCLEFESS